MGGFIYRGKSTDTILSVPLVTGSFDGASNVVETETEHVTGETTITRFIPNEYGVKKNGMEITYGLFKDNGKAFTNEEQIIVERWLTSSKYSSDLVTFDTCTGEQIATYCGIFTHTEWLPGGDGWLGVTFTFKNNHPYAKKHYEYDLSVVKDEETEEYPDNITTTEDEDGTIRYHRIIPVNPNTDEEEEYVYPTIRIEAVERNIELSIINRSDTYLNSSNVRKSWQFDIKPLRGLIAIIDCAHCLLRDETTNGVMNFADVGLGDVGNIYWLRLLPQTNRIEIVTTGECKIKLSFNSPDKNAGGWS